MIQNLTNSSLNESVSRVLGQLPPNVKLPPGCNISIDTITKRWDGSYICVHQMTVNEAMHSFIPLFIIFLIIVTYLSHKKLKPYIEKKLKERYKK